MLQLVKNAYLKTMHSVILLVAVATNMTVTDFSNLIFHRGLVGLIYFVWLLIIRLLAYHNLTMNVFK